MKRTRHLAEQIVTSLRAAEAMLAAGQSLLGCCGGDGHSVRRQITF